MRTEFVRYLRQHGDSIKQAAGSGRKLSLIFATHHWPLFKRAWEKEELSFVLEWLGAERHRGPLTTIVSRCWSIEDYKYFLDNVERNGKRGVQSKREFRTTYAIIYERAKRHWIDGQIVSVVPEVSRHRWPFDSRSGGWKAQAGDSLLAPLNFVQLKGRLLHAAARGQSWSSWRELSGNKLFRPGGGKWTSEILRLGVVSVEDVTIVVRVACKLLGLIQLPSGQTYDPQSDADLHAWEARHFELLLKLLDVHDYAALCDRHPRLERAVRVRCLRRRLFPEASTSVIALNASSP